MSRMQITSNPKTQQGVSQLMVVGDIPSANSILDDHPVGALVAFFALGYLAGVTSGLTKVVMVGAAVAVGYKATQVIKAQPIDDLLTG